MVLRPRDWFLIIAGLGFVLSCGIFDPGEDIDECFPSVANGLEVPDTTVVGQPIVAHITGFIGPSCAYHLEGVTRQQVGRTWVLRPITHHREESGHAYCAAVAYLDEIVTIEPIGSGWFYIFVLSRGPALLDSTFVVAGAEPVVGLGEH